MAPGILSDSGFACEPTIEAVKFVDKTSWQVQAWPELLTGSLAWKGDEYVSDEQYTYLLTEKDKIEIDDALSHFKGLCLDGSEVNRATFPLPALGSILLQCATEVHRGRGFANIRGLDTSRYSPEDNVVIFLGVSSYIGEKRARQNEDGEMLAHIRDAKCSSELEKDRPVRYSTRASTFHTDTFCDILALQTRSCAARGGRHLIASSYNIYNKITALRPDLLDVLTRSDWTFDSRGRLLESNSRPLLFYHGRRIILNFAREPLIGIEGVARAQDLPVISLKQREALDFIESIAHDDQLALNMQPGDLTFINNHAILHSREAFKDNDANPRYLVRLWLRNQALHWKLPRAIQIGNSRIYEDNEIEEKWNVVYVPKVQFKISDRLSS